MKRTYYVYLLSSYMKALYVGTTSNLEGRVRQHKEGVGSRHTSKYKTDRLVYYEQYGYVWDAIQREKQIKAWRRAKKVELIESRNPMWEDLAKDWYDG